MGSLGRRLLPGLYFYIDSVSRPISSVPLFYMSVDLNVSDHRADPEQGTYLEVTFHT